MTNDLKLKIYPAVIAVLGICLAAVLLSRVEIKVWTENVPPEATAPDTEPSATASATAPDPVRSSGPISPASASKPSALSSTTVSGPAAPAGAASQGSLRVSNQTSYPIRVALLSQQTGSSTATKSTSQAYRQPVHWDFAPSEGEANGLLLSLPDSNLQLQTGDVLVAFAQDGSRRYWGPFVVGKTALPTWSAATKEWQLVLRP